MSYAQLPAEVVIHACKGYLDAREKRIKECHELAIARLVGTKSWFWGKPMTREQAEEQCREELYWLEITGGRWARDVRDLLTLATVAQKCNTLVAVNAELASCLNPHFG